MRGNHGQRGKWAYTRLSLAEAVTLTSTRAISSGTVGRRARVKKPTRAVHILRPTLPRSNGLMGAAPLRSIAWTREGGRGENHRRLG